MSLHPQFPTSPYAPLIPEQRWFPADETLRSTAYEKLLPPLVAKIRQEIHEWRNKGYPGASSTSVALLRWWFETDHLLDPFGPKPSGKTTDSKTDLGEIVREVEELAVFNDEAHHIHNPKMAWFKSIQDIHHRMLQKDRRLALQVDVTATSSLLRHP